MDEAKTYRIQETSRMTGLTVRTLHHYDEIGLLKPSSRTPAGYRLYGPEDLLRLQQILVAREIGLPLEQIKRMLDDPQEDRRRRLLKHRELLAERARKTEAMIRSVDAALAAMEGEEMDLQSLDPKEMFDGFDPAEHEAEARERWAETDAYRESARRTRGYSKDDWRRQQEENDAQTARLAELLREGVRSDAEAAMDVADQMRLHIDRWFYPCDRAMHAKLAEMYTMDERFRATFEKHGKGLAQYAADAIRANSARPDA